MDADGGKHGATHLRMVISTIVGETTAYRNAPVLLADVGSQLLGVGAEVLMHLAHCHWVQRPCSQQQGALCTGRLYVS